MKKLRDTVQLKGICYPRSVYPTKVWLDNRFFKPDKSMKIRHHSAARFGWGNDEKGAAQLALAICLELYPKEIAVGIYPIFQKQFITAITEDSFIMSIDLTSFNEKYISPIMELA